MPIAQYLQGGKGSVLACLITLEVSFDLRGGGRAHRGPLQLGGMIGSGGSSEGHDRRNRKNPMPARFDVSTIDTAIRIGLVGLLAYWSLKIIGPFLNIALWSAILTVALYGSFSRLAGWLLNRRRLAAVLITLLCLLS